MDIQNIVYSLKSSIRSKSELEYFHIHQERYKILLNIIDSLNLQKGKKLLDVGCYPLHLFSALKLLGYIVYGVSSKHEPIKASKIKILNIEKNPLPFPNGFFDLILFSEVMEHLISNPLVYLSEFKRVLALTGRLIVTTPNAAGLHKIIPIILGRSTYFPLSELYQTNINDDSIYFRHNREFTLNELKTIVTNAGFKIERAAYVSFYTPNRKGRKSPLTHAIGYAVTNVIASARDSLLILATRSWINGSFS